MSTAQWTDKQVQFNAAMQAYEHQPIYRKVNGLVSYLNFGLQVVLLGLSIISPISDFEHVVLFLLAFVAADFINGLVHLYMDHNAHYDSAVGPFIAAFHLHHDTPRYTDKAIWRVYLDESGYKVWLLGVLLLTLAAQLAGALPAAALVFLTYFGICSCWAEVSHFLCHNSDAQWVKRLQKYWILLPKRHHMQHHRLDNVNYAFLNGMTDPLINRLAQRFGHGYRSSTDLDLALYQHLKKR